MLTLRVIPSTNFVYYFNYVFVHSPVEHNFRTLTHNYQLRQRILRIFNISNNISNYSSDKRDIFITWFHKKNTWILRPLRCIANGAFAWSKLVFQFNIVGRFYIFPTFFSRRIPLYFPISTFRPDIKFWVFHSALSSREPSFECRPRVTR